MSTSALVNEGMDLGLEGIFDEERRLGQKEISRLETELAHRAAEKFQAEQELYTTRMDGVLSLDNPRDRRFDLGSIYYLCDENGTPTSQPGERFVQLRSIAEGTGGWGKEFDKKLEEIIGLISSEDPRVLIQKLDVLTQFAGKDGQNRNTKVDFEKATQLRDLLIELSIAASKVAESVSEKTLWMTDSEDGNKQKLEKQAEDLITLSVALNIDARVLYSQIDLTQQLIQEELQPIEETGNDMGEVELPIGQVNKQTAKVVSEIPVEGERVDNTNDDLDPELKAVSEHMNRLILGEKPQGITDSHQTRAESKEPEEIDPEILALREQMEKIIHRRKDEPGFDLDSLPPLFNSKQELKAWVLRKTYEEAGTAEAKNWKYDRRSGDRDAIKLKLKESHYSPADLKERLLADNIRRGAFKEQFQAFTGVENGEFQPGGLIAQVGEGIHEIQREEEVAFVRRERVATTMTPIRETMLTQLEEERAVPEGLRSQDAISLLEDGLASIEDKIDAIQREVELTPEDRRLLSKAENRIRATLNVKAQEEVYAMSRDEDRFKEYNALDGNTDELKEQDWLIKVGAKGFKPEDLDIVRLGGISMLREARETIDPLQEKITEDDWETMLVAIVVAKQLEALNSSKLQLVTEGVDYPDLEAARILDSLLLEIRTVDEDEIKKRLIDFQEQMLAMIGGNDKAYALQQANERVYILGQEKFSTGDAWVDEITDESRADYPLEHVVALGDLWLDNLSDMDVAPSRVRVAKQ